MASGWRDGSSAPLVGRFEGDDPFDEDVIALEYLLAAVELVNDVRGASIERKTLAARIGQVLAREAHG